MSSPVKALFRPFTPHKGTLIRSSRSRRIASMELHRGWINRLRLMCSHVGLAARAVECLPSSVSLLVLILPVCLPPPPPTDGNRLRTPAMDVIDTPMREGAGCRCLLSWMHRLTLRRQAPPPEDSGGGA